MKGYSIGGLCVVAAMVLFLPFWSSVKGASQLVAPGQVKVGGQVIAFASDRDGGFFQTFVMKANGFKQTQLTHDLFYNARPNWSDDGRKITFSACRASDSSCEIYVMNADGSGQTNLSNNPATEQMSVWSPDDRKIAFVSDRDGFSQIYVMNTDGSDQTRLSDGSGADLFPVGRLTEARSPSKVIAMAMLRCM